MTEATHKAAEDMTAREKAALALYASLPNLPSVGPNIIQPTSGDMTNREFLLAATITAQENLIDKTLRAAHGGPAQSAPGTGGPKSGPSNTSN